MWQNIIIRIVLGLLGDFLKEAIKVLTSKDVMDKLGLLALRHVENFSKSITMSNDEKRKAACQALKDDTIRLGIVAKDWAIDTAVQVAYGKLKADLEKRNVR